MRVIIFGAGKALEEVLASDVISEHELVAIADNSVQKIGQKIRIKGDEFEILPADNLTSVSFDRLYISVCDRGSIFEITMQLGKLGIDTNKIFARNKEDWVAVPLVRPWPQQSIQEGRIFYDVTQIANKDIGTGIQRVVNNLFANLRNLYNERIIPSRGLRACCITARSYSCRLDGTSFDNVEYTLNFSNTDKLLMADASWKPAARILEGGFGEPAEIFAIVYDLMPLNREWFPESLSLQFEAWITSVLRHADGIVCISRTVANKVEAYFKEKRIDRESPLRVYVCSHWGANIPALVGTAREKIKSFVKRAKTFLMVGNVDVRKNQILALQAMKEIVEHHPETDIQLLILGRKAYRHEEVETYLADNPVLEKRVLWVIGASDEELQWAYKNTEALLFLSKEEGFGLPLVEAAYHGLPILCSDIPVFHEVAGDGATYVDIDNPQNVATSLLKWIEKGNHPDSRIIPIHTWDKTAWEIAEILEEKSEPYMIL